MANACTIARHLAVSHVHVSRIQAGKGYPSQRLMIDIAGVLDWPLEDQAALRWSADPRAYSREFNRRAEKTFPEPEPITHCPQGHEYTEDNIYWGGPKRPSHRKCRECALARARNRVPKKRSKVTK